MPAGLKDFLQQWIINTLAVLVATYIAPGIHFGAWHDLLVATFILGILNTFVRPVMTLLSLPLVVLTLGLFRWVINAFLLYAVSWLLGPAFQIDTFGQALLGALIISIIVLALGQFTGTSRTRIEVRRGGPKPRRPGSNSDDGPVIDV